MGACSGYSVSPVPCVLLWTPLLPPPLWMADQCVSHLSAVGPLCPPFSCLCTPLSPIPSIMTRLPSRLLRSANPLVLPVLLPDVAPFFQLLDDCHFAGNIGREVADGQRGDQNRSGDQRWGYRIPLRRAPWSDGNCGGAACGCTQVLAGGKFTGVRNSPGENARPRAPGV